jgi:hypothetical protein
MEKNGFKITLKNFYQGYAPLAHLSSVTELGNEGHASQMVNADVLGEVLQQGPGLANLTNGTQAGVVSELINYILDTPPASDSTYGIGATKLFKISSTAVASGGTPSWPKTITSATAGKTVAYLKGVLYYFFNTSSDSTIGNYDLASTFNDAWQTGLVKATLIPVAVKEDIMLFGHGRYVGTYFSNTATINKTKLDFGTNTEVADICFNANQWLIAVNSGITGTNRNQSQIFSYEAGATTTLLSDEVSVGVQKIGWLYPLNGVVYVAYQDLSFSGGYKIGYISGRRIEPLVNFTGSLPTYAQRTLYKDTILFLSSGLVYSAGAISPELPFAISQLADGGYATCGALSAPFGTPMIASTESTTYKLAQFSNYDVNSSWRSITIPVINEKMNGYIDEIVVRTNTLTSGASAALQLEFNQGSSTSETHTITTTGKRKHTFNVNQSDIEDFRVYINYAGSSTTANCPIKEIVVYGHYMERG